MATQYNTGAGYYSPSSPKPDLPRSISTTNLETTKRCRAVIQQDWCSTVPMGGTNFFTSTPYFTLTLPALTDYPTEFQQFFFERIIDKETQRALEGEKCLNWCPSATKLVPLYTLGDGNCLLHAASLGMWGFQDRDHILRRAVAHACFNTEGNTFYRRWQYNREQENLQFGLQLEQLQWQREWEIVVNQASAEVPARGNLDSLKEFHIFVLANVLRRPVVMYAVPKMRSVQGATLQGVNFHGIYLPLLWDPHSCKKDPLPLSFYGGHFSALVVIDSPGQYRNGYLLLPLTDYYGQQLPIRFALPQEDPTSLMMDYLNLMQIQNHGSPYFQHHVVCAKMMIAEIAVYLKPLVSSFIGACYDAYVSQAQKQRQQQSGFATPTTHAQSRQSAAPPTQLSQQLKRHVQVAKTKAEQAGSKTLVTDQKVLEADRRAQLAEHRAQAVEKAVQEVQSLCKQAMRTAEDAKKKAEDSERRAKAAERRAEAAERRAEAAERRAEAAEGRIGSVEALTRRVQELERSVQSGQSDAQEKLFWAVQREEIQITNEELGRGGWGAIVVALFRGQRVAAKKLHNQIISPHNLRLFTREMNMAARVRHPNLLQFIGATTEGEPIILTELMHTSLRNVLASNPLSWAQVMSIFSDVIRALNYLHLMHPSPIIHRDISSANVLLEPSSRTTWKAKVSDFGSTNFVSQVSTTGPGNPLYAAPEAYNPYQQSPKMDIFSCGILLIETCTRQLPPVEEREQMIGQIPWPVVVPLVRQCIHEDRDRRPTSQDILRQLDLFSGQR